jgi:hypothetical protein
LVAEANPCRNHSAPEDNLLPFSFPAVSTQEGHCRFCDVTTQGLDIRFVVTSLETGSAERVTREFTQNCSSLR